MDRLEELKSSVPQGKYILVLNFDMHSNKYGLNPLPESTPSTWASEAENRGLAYVPHFRAFLNEDAPGSGWDHNWNNKKDLSEIMQEILKRKDEIYEVWVTIDYDFFYVYLANNLFNKTGVESSIQEITTFLRDSKLWPKRLINVISRVCLPDGESTSQKSIDAITNIIEESFSAPKTSSAGSDIVQLDISRCGLDPKDKYFPRAVEYFNEHMVGKVITWKEIISLFEKYRGDDLNPLYTDKVRGRRLKSIKESQFIDFKGVLTWINQKWPTEEEIFKAAMKVYVRTVGECQENQLFVKQSYGMFGCPGLPGFDKIQSLSDGGMQGASHPGVGHHRLGWFLMNYVLINNGFTPVYLTDEERGGHGLYGVMHQPQNIEKAIRERTRSIQVRPSRNKAILPIYQKFLYFKCYSGETHSQRPTDQAITLLLKARVAMETVKTVNDRFFPSKNYIYDLSPDISNQVARIEAFLDRESLRQGFVSDEVLIEGISEILGHHQHSESRSSSAGEADAVAEYLVKIMPDGKLVNARKGEILIDILERNHLELDTECGKQGICGRCTVKLNRGSVEIGDKPVVAKEHAAAKEILSCQAKVIGPIEITVPIKSRRGISKISEIDDYDFLRGVEQGNAIVNIKEYGGLAYCLAVDIGTTTVAASLIPLSGRINMEKIETASDINWQAEYGGSVIDRIGYMQAPENKERRIKKLQDSIIGCINSLIRALIKKTNIDKDAIVASIFSGNSTMTHMALGLDAAGIGQGPEYRMVESHPAPRKASALSLNINPEASVFSVPCVHGFIGGDVIAGLLITGMAQKEELSFLIDFGTNGEMVLGNKDRLLATSCAIGPAFEGMGVSCGMRAAEGAIESLNIDKDSLEPAFKTVGNKGPSGVCGTGLIDILAEMARCSIINSMGRIDEKIEHPRIRKAKDMTDSHRNYEYLIWQDSFNPDDYVSITEDDLKEIIKAKAAVYAAIRMLLKETGKEVGDIKHVYIAGGFSAFLDIEKAAYLGLLPDILLKDIKDRTANYSIIGNSSLKGTVLMAMDKDYYEEAYSLANAVEYVDLQHEDKRQLFNDLMFGEAWLLPEALLDNGDKTSVFDATKAKASSAGATNTDSRLSTQSSYDLADFPAFKSSPLPLLGYAAASIMKEDEIKRDWIPVTIEQASSNSQSLFELIVFIATFFNLKAFFVPMDLSAEAEAIAKANGIDIIINMGKDKETGLEIAPERGHNETLFRHDRLLFDENTIRTLKPPDPWEHGRVPVYLRALQGVDALEELDNSIKDPWTKIAYITGPYTLAAELLGSEEAMIATVENDTRLFDLLMLYCKDVVKRNAKAFIDAGADAIMILDPEASNLSFNKLPSEENITGFERYCEQPIDEVTNYINSLGIPVLLHTCVTRSHMLRPLARINVQGYSLDINVDMREAYDVLIPPGSKKVVVGNIDTTLLCYGPVEKIRAEVVRLMEKMKGCERFILATSCDVAPTTPSEHIVALCQAYHDWYQQQKPAASPNAAKAYYFKPVKAIASAA